MRNIRKQLFAEHGIKWKPVFETGFQSLLQKNRTVCALIKLKETLFRKHFNIHQKSFIPKPYFGNLSLVYASLYELSTTDRRLPLGGS